GAGPDGSTAPTRYGCLMSSAPSSLPEVIHRLQAIEASAPHTDGIVCFAGLFFSALESYERDAASAPSAWMPLFAQRSRHGIAPLQFALAGMNAHINRDLPVALVSTCRELSLDLREASPEHADFERVDALLSQVERRVKSSYLTGWLAWVDRLVHRLRRL